MWQLLQAKQLKRKEQKLAKANEQTEYDVLIAPGTEFKKVFDEDEDNSVWKCINQPFYDEEVEDDGE